MLYLTQALADEYMKLNPGVSIYVEGGGTASGINSFTKGEIDICTASRTLKPEEVKLIAEKFGSVGMATLVAKDALSIFINPQNPVKDFQIDEVKNIFTGSITNWNMLGGDNADVMAIIRNPNSGTYLYFKEHILDGEEYSPSAITEATTEKIISAVKENKNAIGYGGLAYGDKNLHAKINGIEPTEENVINDKYPVTRYLHFYTLFQPDGIVKNFIDWVLSPAGQAVVKKIGYIQIYKREF